MLKPDYDVVAIGNAMVDVLAHVTPEFIRLNIEERGLRKGGMNLVEGDIAVQILARMKDPAMRSGGSASNMLFGIRSFGGKCAFIGKVAGDPIGKDFRKFLQEEGIIFTTPPLESASSSATGRSLVLIAPDGSRTMATFLGANKMLSENDIDEELVASARFAYLEGYLFDQPLAQKALEHAAGVAKSAGRNVVLNLCDPYLVERHQAAFQGFVKNYANILFATEKEIKNLYGAKSLVAAINAVKQDCEIVAITRSEKGSVIVRGDDVLEVEAKQVQVVDVTGAGDQYAAGFIHGLVRGLSLKACARLGTAAAAEVITHAGAQPQSSYSALIVKELVRSLGDR